MATPHRMVGQAIDGLAEGVKGVVNTVIGGMQGAGESVMQAADAPLQDTLGATGPHRILDAVLDGSADAVKTAINQGLVGSFQQFGHGVAKGLDNPIEQLGILPELGDFGPAPQLPFNTRRKW